jgi:membrane protease YdiL (CAAX protease family)
MTEKHRFLNFYGEPPLAQLFVSILIIVGVGAILASVLVAAGMGIFGADLNILTKSDSSLTGNEISFIRYILIIQDISFLFIPGVILLSAMKQPGSMFNELKIPELKDIGLVILLTICVFPISGFTGQINSAIHLPSWLSGLEQWMMDKEKSADNLINSLIVSDTFWTMSLNLLIIALIPAISEEMIFRGVLQKIFTRLFRSGHLAIWVTAFIFSAIHFQFLGFIPRFILGLVFGYLFFWGGSLWLPVISHFVNNAFPVILTYGQGIEIASATPDIPLWKQAIALPIPIVIIIVILFYFRNKSNSLQKGNIGNFP